MKLIYSIIAFFISCFIPSVFAHTPVVTKTVSPLSFSKLNVRGPVNVFINAQKTLSATMDPANLQIKGNAQGVNAVTWKIKNDTLFIGTKWNYCPQPNDHLIVYIKVNPQQLTYIDFDSNASLIGTNLSGKLELSANGKGHIIINSNKLNLASLSAKDQISILLTNLSSNNLTIQDSSSGKIKLTGQINLHSVTTNKHSDLSIYWINSPYVTVNSKGYSHIFLAGVTKTLDANLLQKTQLCAKPLHSETAFITTKNYALASVTTQQLNAKASDQSRIQYTSSPQTLHRYTQGRGLVLSISPTSQA